MKKKIIILFIIILVILLIAFLVKVWNDLLNTQKSTHISSPGIEDKAITNYISSLFEGYKEDKQYFMTFYSSKILKFDYTPENQIIYYTWILSKSYCEQDGNVVEVVSSSCPYKFTFSDSKTIIKCEVPDADDYANSVKSIFPDDVIQEFPNESELVSMNEDIQYQVKQYYTTHSTENIIGLQ